MYVLGNCFRRMAKPDRPPKRYGTAKQTAAGPFFGAYIWGLPLSANTCTAMVPLHSRSGY